MGGRLSARSRAGTIDAEGHQLTAAGAELSGRVRVGEGRRLEGRLHATVPDVARTVGQSEIFLARAPGSLVPAVVTGAADIEARLGGTLDKPIASVKVSAPSVSAGAANGIGIGADLTVTSEAVTIARAETAWNGAHAALNGKVGLTGRRPLDLVVDVEAGDLQHLVRGAGPWATSVSGRIGGHATIRGTVATPLASLTLQGAGLTAFGERLGSLTADATLTGRDVTLSRLAIDKPQPDAPGSLTATGSVQPGSTELHVRPALGQPSSSRRPLAGGTADSGPASTLGKWSGRREFTFRHGECGVRFTRGRWSSGRANRPDFDNGGEPSGDRHRVGRALPSRRERLDRPRAAVADDGHDPRERPRPRRLPLGFENPVGGRLRATVNATGDSRRAAGCARDGEHRDDDRHVERTTIQRDEPARAAIREPASPHRPPGGDRRRIVAGGEGSASTHRVLPKPATSTSRHTRTWRRCLGCCRRRQRERRWSGDVGWVRPRHPEVDRPRISC